jgi:hypothetical protein
MPHLSVAPGTLAYLDTFAGLIPCKVTAAHDERHVTVRVTADRRAFRRGELITSRVGSGGVIPRTAVYTRGGQYRIAGFDVIAYPARDYTPAPADSHLADLPGVRPAWIV